MKKSDFNPLPELVEGLSPRLNKSVDGIDFEAPSLFQRRSLSKGSQKKSMKAYKMNHSFGRKTDLFKSCQEKRSNNRSPSIAETTSDFTSQLSKIQEKSLNL